MTPMDIERMSKALRLGNLRHGFRAIIDEAVRGSMSYRDFLGLVLERELESREDGRIAKRMKAARFPFHRTFEGLDWSAFSARASGAIRELQSLRFVEEGRNAVPIGNPGVGKTHVAIAVGMLACQKGKSVLFESVPNLALELKEAMGQRRLLALKGKLMSYGLLALDGLGYVGFCQEAPQLLFGLRRAGPRGSRRW